MTRKIIITSIDNEDWNGTWDKVEVEDTLHELGIAIHDGDLWIDWVFDHVFDNTIDFNEELRDIIVKNDKLVKASFELHDGYVTITKV